MQGAINEHDPSSHYDAMQPLDVDLSRLPLERRAVLGFRHTCELQVEFGRAPVLRGAVAVLNLEDDIRRRAPGSLQPVEDPRPQRRVACEQRFETAACLRRRRDDRQFESIERKHLCAAAGRLDLLLDGVKAMARTISRGSRGRGRVMLFAASSSFAAIVDSSRRALPRTFMSPHRSRPARVAASTISPAAGAALPPP